MMWKNLLAIGLMCSSSMVGACLLEKATQLPLNTPVALSPSVYNAVVANPAYGTAILAARDAWNVTNARNRIGNWSGVVTNSDCPTGQPFQVGAIAFTNSTCEPLIGNFPDPTTRNSFLAFVDYDPRKCTGSGCGTKSVTLNLNYSWSLNPILGEYDIQSVLAHEFGHVLGLAHQDQGLCDQTSSPTCLTTPGRETMGAQVPSWITWSSCIRDLSTNDVNSANQLY